MLQISFLHAFLLPWRCLYIWFLCKYLYCLICFFTSFMHTSVARNHFKSCSLRNSFKTFDVCETLIWCREAQSVEISTCLLEQFCQHSPAASPSRHISSLSQRQQHKEGPAPAFQQLLAFLLEVTVLGVDGQRDGMLYKAGSHFIESFLLYEWWEEAILLLNEAQIFNYPLILRNTFILCSMLASMAIK